jgi:hypothetical protein
MPPRPIRRSPRPAAGLLLAAALAAGTTSACSSTAAPSSTSGRSSASTTASTPAPTTAPASPSASGPVSTPASPPVTASPPTTAPPGTLTLDEHAARTTVHLRVGAALVVRLHSTYWSTPAVSAPSVLSPAGGGSTPGGTCRPGGGCGVSSASFTAVRPGLAQVTAHRDSCGEAMRCPPGQGDYAVTIAVDR